MKNIILSGFLALFSFTPAIANENSPIVLELFTSQSCSSCPPADRVLREQAKKKNIIALSCHVTYWNHLHWKDTLSQELCTKRQRQYVRSLNARGPYTPQIVINGRYELVGSRGRKVENIVEGKNNHIHSIDLKKVSHNLEMTLPEMKTGRYLLLLVSYGEDHTQDIPSGENRGRTVSYTNPVNTIKVLGSWDGKMKTLNHDISQYGDDGGVAVLVHQTNEVGPIVAAGKLDF